MVFTLMIDSRSLHTTVKLNYELYLLHKSNRPRTDSYTVAEFQNNHDRL